MNKQKAILNRLAKEHGITIGQAEEIWKLLVDKIAITISDPDKKGEDNLYDIEKFPIIHIDNFGKFIPNVKNLTYANIHLKKRFEEDDKSIT
tara:strand:+ start:230 stop:505 length:276 start_codon:yes stop_codon:yes gene_type:complete